jgi:hypothetical protein
MVLDTPWVADEGAYALQVRTLESGSWEYPYVARPIDAGGSWFPLVATSPVATDSGLVWFPYAKHPAYPAALWFVTRFVTPGGLYLLPIVGCLLAAVAAGMLAGEVDRKLMRPAFWVAAAGPIFVNAFVLWAHSLSAAFGGLALLAAVRIVRCGVGALRTAGLYSALILGIAIRSEAQVFGVALMLALAAVMLRSRPAGRWLLLRVPLGGIAVVLVARLVEHQAIRLITGGQPAADELRRGGSGMSYLGGRWTGLYHILFQGSEHSHVASRIVLLALILVVASAVLLCRARARPPAPIGRPMFAAAALVVSAMVIYYLRFERTAFESQTGLFAAWPLTVLGLLSLRWRRAGSALWLIAGTGVLFLAGIAATQYPEGGGLEWGGRFLSPMLAGVAVLSAAGLRRVSHLSATPTRRAVVWSLAIILGVVPMAEGVLLLRRVRISKIDLIRSAELAGDLPIVVGDIRLVELPRLAWRLYPGTDWVMAPKGDAGDVIARLQKAGFTELAVLEPADVSQSHHAGFAHKTEVVTPLLRGAGLRLVVLRS